MNQESVGKLSAILCDMKILTWFFRPGLIFFRGRLPMLVYGIRYFSSRSTWNEIWCKDLYGTNRS